MSRRKGGDQPDRVTKNRNIKLLAELMDRGVMNYLNAKMIAETAVAVQGTNFSAVKPFRTPPDDLDYHMAADLIVDYLARSSLAETPKCIRAELPDLLPETATPARLRTHLDIGDSPDSTGLRTLLHSWLQDGSEIRERNQQSLMRLIERRLDSLAPARVGSSAPRPAAAPKPQTAKQSPGPPPASRAAGVLPPPQSKPPAPGRTSAGSSVPQDGHHSQTDSLDRFTDDSDGPAPFRPPAPIPQHPSAKQVPGPDPRREPHRGEGKPTGRPQSALPQRAPGGTEMRTNSTALSSSLMQTGSDQRGAAPKPGNAPLMPFRTSQQLYDSGEDDAFASDSTEQRRPVSRQPPRGTQLGPGGFSLDRAAPHEGSLRPGPGVQTGRSAIPPRGTAQPPAANPSAKGYGKVVPARVDLYDASDSFDSFSH